MEGVGMGKHLLYIIRFSDDFFQFALQVTYLRPPYHYMSYYIHNAIQFMLVSILIENNSEKGAPFPWKGSPIVSGLLVKIGNHLSNFSTNSKDKLFT